MKKKYRMILGSSKSKRPYHIETKCNDRWVVLFGGLTLDEAQSYLLNPEAIEQRVLISTIGTFIFFGCALFFIVWSIL